MSEPVGNVDGVFINVVDIERQQAFQGAVHG